MKETVENEFEGEIRTLLMMFYNVAQTPINGVGCHSEAMIKANEVANRLYLKYITTKPHPTCSSCKHLSQIGYNAACAKAILLSDPFIFSLDPNKDYCCKHEQK